MSSPPAFRILNVAAIALYLVGIAVLTAGAKDDPLPSASKAGSPIAASQSPSIAANAEQSWWRWSKPAKNDLFLVNLTLSGAESGEFAGSSVCDLRSLPNRTCVVHFRVEKGRHLGLHISEIEGRNGEFRIAIGEGDHSGSPFPRRIWAFDLPLSVFGPAESTLVDATFKGAFRIIADLKHLGSGIEFSGKHGTRPIKATLRFSHPPRQ